MVNKSRGILKNGPRYREEDASSENLLFSSDPFHAAHIETTIDLGMPPVERFEKSEKRAHDESAFVEIGLANESDCESTHEEHHPAVHRVQFPDTVSKAPPYIRQDTDVMSTRSGASSVYGGDEDDSEDYDWSDEEDLVDEQAKFNKKLGSKKGIRAWGPTRLLIRFHVTLFRLTLNIGSSPSSFLLSLALSSLHALSSRLRFLSTSTGISLIQRSTART